MMAQDPNKRPQEAAEVVGELEEIKRELSAPQAPEELMEVSEIADDQRSMFKPLPPARIMRIQRLDVTQEQLTRMIMSLNSDGGVFIEMSPPYPPNSAVQVRFADPVRDQEYDGVGLVRWSSPAPPMQGMGITFIKVSHVSKGDKDSDNAPLTGPMAIQALTQSPLHERILRYIYTNAGQLVDIAGLAGAVGCGPKMLMDPLRLFERAAMVKKDPQGRMILKWPDDESLQREIISWISSNRL